MGRVAHPGATSVDNCTAEPLYVGCFEDRESQANGRDLRGARFSMAADASVAHCAHLCAGHRVSGMQFTDQCFCANSYGSYAQLDDEFCGAKGSAVDRTATMRTTVAR